MVRRRGRRRSYVAAALLAAGFVVLCSHGIFSCVVNGLDWEYFRLHDVLVFLYWYRAIDPSVAPGLLAVTFDTIGMATAGSLSGFVVAASILALRFIRGRAGVLARALGGGCLALSRAVHPLVWAVAGVAAFGAGPAAGILALAIRSVADYGGFVRHKDQGIQEAVGPPSDVGRCLAAAGIVNWSRNIRRATVLGLVGGGGLGHAFMQHLTSYDYGSANVALLLCAMLWALAQAAQSLTERQATESQSRLAGSTPPRRSPFLRSSQLGALVLLLLAGASLVHLDLLEVIAIANVSAGSVVALPSPTALTPPALISVLDAVAVSVEMALLATLTGWVTAWSVTGLFNRWRRVRGTVFRASLPLFAALAWIPDMFIVVLLVAALGPGSFSGLLAVSVGAVGYFGADLCRRRLGLGAGDAASGGPPGTGRVSIGGRALDGFGLALRSTVVIGVFGAGGTGWLLEESLILGANQRAGLIVLVVVSISLLADRARVPPAGRLIRGRPVS